MVIITSWFVTIADCFGVYDLNDDGYISREEMFQMLKNTMAKQLTEEDPDEGIKEIVESMVKKMVCVCVPVCVGMWMCGDSHLED